MCCSWTTSRFFKKKEQTQIEFLHTFNDLYNANKLIVLASDDAPNDMSEIEERIKTRFLWGVTARIYPPEFETRVAILKRKAADIGAAELEDEAAEYLAERISSNIRELEGALMTAFQHARLLRVPISADVAQEALGGGRQHRRGRVCLGEAGAGNDRPTFTASERPT